MNKWHTYTEEEVIQIIKLWATHTRREIAAELKIKQNIVDTILWELRSQGYKLPARKPKKTSLKSIVAKIVSESK